MKSEHLGQAQKILVWFASRKGATSTECEAALRFRTSPRISDLERLGCLRRTDEKRRTSSMRGTARVYEVVEGAMEKLFTSLPVPKPRRVLLSPDDLVKLRAARAYVSAVARATSERARRVHVTSMKKFARAMHPLVVKAKHQDRRELLR